MLEPSNNSQLPEIPAKRYFTIGEVSELCQVKPHVLRYWEQEFTQLKPVKRRGNRRYYQRQDVLLIRQIRTLLYEHGFTIGGARQQLQNSSNSELAAYLVQATTFSSVDPKTHDLSSHHQSEHEIKKAELRAHLGELINEVEAVLKMLN
jgi:DNA-binding transcriptional MerR regulator